jgi:hypothetical protein
MHARYHEEKPKKVKLLKFKVHVYLKGRTKSVGDSLDKQFGKTAKSTRSWTARYFY